MSIESIINKLKGVEGLNLSDDEIKELQQKPDDTAINEERSKSKRILEEKKKAVLRLAEVEGELETIKDKDLDEIQKAAKGLEKLAKESADKDIALQALNQRLETTVKSYNLEKIGNNIAFMDNIPAELKSIAIEKVFGNIDMADTEALKEANNAFSETYKGILATDTAAKGAGSNPGSSGNIKSNDPSKQSTEDRASHLKNM